jgi:hypothetical protein
VPPAHTSGFDEAMFLNDHRARLADLDLATSQQERLLQDLREHRAAVQSQLDLFVYQS